MTTSGKAKIPLLSPADDRLWELFHENSKTSRFEPQLPGHEIIERMKEMVESLDYQQYPAIPLPEQLLPLDRAVGDVMRSRVSARGLEPCEVSLPQLSTLLEYCYGVTRDNEGTLFPRPFRIVPSGGALYPLEIYVHTARLEGCEPGLYHYNPTARLLRHLRYGDDSRRLAQALVQHQLALDSSALFFVTALFERSTFKYGSRGYRFALLEAGHVVQNLNLAAAALGFSSVNVGGYFDHQVDELLGIDGVTHSTVYICALGRSSDKSGMASGFF